MKKLIEKEKCSYRATSSDLTEGRHEVQVCLQQALSAAEWKHRSLVEIGEAVSAGALLVSVHVPAAQFLIGYSSVLARVHCHNGKPTTLQCCQPRGIQHRRLYLFPSLLFDVRSCGHEQRASKLILGAVQSAEDRAVCLAYPGSVEFEAVFRSAEVLYRFKKRHSHRTREYIENEIYAIRLCYLNAIRATLIKYRRRVIQ